VTPQDQIDLFIALGQLEDVTLATFGDMVRVPGKTKTVEQARAEGADVLVVYSPMDAVEAAVHRPERQVVFFGIGFETTAPAVALAILEAQRRKLENFSVLCAHKLIPPALAALIGSNAYESVAARGKPCVVTGFEPADLLGAVRMLLTQLAEGKSEVECEYARVVRPEGNPKAQELLARVFRAADTRWRGLGTIPGSGYDLAEEFAEFDAARRFEIEQPRSAEPKGCRCGDVLRGAIDPPECPLFGQSCTPRKPVGSCMVSSEGACQAWYRYRRRA
jgi:hydrogenase expression/formation protein HypD